MASENGRGAQVRLDSDARRIARGGTGLRLIDNIRQQAEVVASGAAADGNLPDGSTLTGTAADDEMLVPGGEEGTYTFKASGAGTVSRSVPDKLQDEPSLTDFGADRTGVADAAAAVSAMAAALGYVRFPAGTFRMGTATIDVPVYFDPGAAISADGGATVTFRDAVESPRQWIFRGAGSVAFAHNTTSNLGEQARHAHISWFGAFPSNALATDQSPAIQRAVDAMDNTREAILDFDMGNYYLGSTVTGKRGTWIRGNGTRRTVFHFIADGYDGFVSGNVLFKITDCSFESNVYPRNTGACVKLAHGECEAYNVHCIGSAFGVVVTGSACRVDNITGSWGAQPDLAGALVHVAATTNGTRVSNVLAGTSSFAPGAIVRVGGAGGGTVNGVLVENVSYIAPATVGVHVDAASVSVSRVSIKGISYNGTNGTAPDWIAAITTTGTGSVADVSLGDVVAGAYATGGIKVSQNSTSSLKDVVIDRVTMAGTAGVGILLEKITGTLQDIYVGSAVNVQSYATPVSITGGPANVKVSPQILPATNPVASTAQTIADDAVWTIDLQRSLFTGVVILSTNNNPQQFGLFTVRAATGPQVVPIVTPSSNVVASTGALTGTTGTDGKLTLSAADKFLYVENRLGASVVVSLALLSGN